jgi:Ran GTPase-activating protein (RanGAP) involved in mRNA processing and transport
MTLLVNVSPRNLLGAIDLIDVDVTALDFARCDREHVSFLSSFIRALSRCPLVTHFYFSENDIGDSGLSKLGKALASLSKLRVLDLSYNGVGDVGIVALCPHIAALPLKKLDLSINNIGSQGVAALGKALRTSKTLKCLYLYGTAVTFNDVWTLVLALSNVHTLKEIVVDETAVTRAEIRILSKKRPQICFSYWN